MCPVWNHQKGEDIPTEQWKAIMNKISKYSIWSCVEGGEPTLRNDIVEILQHLKKLGGFVQLTTNSSLLHKFDYKEFSEVDTVCCGLDTNDKKTFSAQRGVPKIFFNRVINNIKKLNDYGIPRFTNPVITKFNVEEFISHEYFHFIQNELGISLCTPTVVEPYPTVTHNTLPDTDKLKEVAKSILEFMKKENKLVIGTPPLYWKQILEYGRPFYNTCGVWKSINFDPNGRVVIPCWKFEKNSKGFDVLQSEVNDLWSDSVWANINGCHDCKFLHCHWMASQNMLTLLSTYVKGVFNYPFRKMKKK